MEDIRDKVYVVGYWCNIACVTSDKELANKVCDKKRGEASALPWGVRTIQKALEHAYEAGQEDGSF